MGESDDFGDHTPDLFVVLTGERVFDIAADSLLGLINGRLFFSLAEVTVGVVDGTA